MLLLLLLRLLRLRLRLLLLLLLLLPQVLLGHATLVAIHLDALIHTPHCLQRACGAQQCCGGNEVPVLEWSAACCVTAVRRHTGQSSHTQAVQDLVTEQ